MPTPSCPPAADLEAFHAGRLAAAAADAVATHLEGCAACEAVLQRLDADEATALVGLRTPARPPEAGAGGAAGDRLGGRYTLLEPLGEGGMGAVWRADQTEPVRRPVAVKLVKAGMDSAAVLRRFEAERQALALMDHPNIAKVLDAGTTDAGRPFFAMELVQGVPITRYCDEHRLTPRQRLELFVPVCRAVQHAHQKGVIHRDLKPSNILVAEVDGKPVPKVIDFGIAKAAGATLADQTLVTGLGMVVGTPEYMAPEQAGGDPADVDTRADVYALGVLLYELLTGTTPLTRVRLQQAALLEVLRLVREEEPPAPSSRLSTADALPSIAASRQTEPRRLTGLVRGDLDWIVLKALEKDRGRRYETAAGFAADVLRHLADEPVEAGRPSAGYRLRKLVRRNRGLVLAGSLVLTAVLTGAGASVWQAVRATRERDQKQAALDRAAEELATREAVLRFFNEAVLAAGRPEGQAGGLGKDVSLRRAVDAAVPRIGPAFADRPAVEASVRRMLGGSYFYLGEYGRGVEQLDRVRHLLEATLGTGHIDVIAVTADLADAHAEAGHQAEALRLFEGVRAAREARLGPDHPDTLTSRNSLGTLLTSMGRYADAAAELEGVRAARTSALGPDHLDTLRAGNDLGVVYFHLGRFPEAVALFERARDGRRAALGPAHPDTLKSQNNLASGYARTGRMDESVGVFREVIRVKTDRLGRDHLSTLNSQNNLGYTLTRAGRPAEAVPILEDAVSRLTATLGARHYATLPAANSLAEAYHRAGRSAEALPRYRRLLADRRAALPPGHQDVARTAQELIEVCLAAGRPAEAGAVYAEAVGGPALAAAYERFRSRIAAACHWARERLE